MTASKNRARDLRTLRHPGEPDLTLNTVPAERYIEIVGGMKEGDITWVFEYLNEALPDGEDLDDVVSRYGGLVSMVNRITALVVGKVEDQEGSSG